MELAYVGELRRQVLPCPTGRRTGTGVHGIALQDIAISCFDREKKT